MTDFSQFDPQSFLDATVDVAFERRNPLPIGDYVGVIGELAARSWAKKDDPTKNGIAFDVPITIDVPPALQSALELPPTLKVRDGIMLDLTDSGTIDHAKGKNGKLRTYRDATGTNVPGVPFSPRQLTGKVITVKITHETYNDTIQERVGAVAKPA